jgi:putative transcriptional regulator
MQHAVKPGDLLVAPPNIQDHRFREAVILLTDHDHKGSVGLALNRATDYRVNDLITPLRVEIPWDPYLHWGGPVGQDMTYMLHTPEWRLDNYTRNTTDNWSVTQHWSMYLHLSDHDEPQHWRIFAGCCAWAPGQLDRELAGARPWQPAHSWLILRDPPVSQILNIEPLDLWGWACDRTAAQTTSAWMA